jgi:hypothetical protein
MTNLELFDPWICTEFCGSDILPCGRIGFWKIGVRL